METPAPAREVFGEAVETAARYAGLLATRGVEWGLLGPREVERIWHRHVLNSVAVASEVPVGATVVDVGSGAGLPGIPLALARPDCRVVLLEPLLRRSTFLTGVVEELGLDERVTVVRGRAEEHAATYDVVTCRALAPLVRLVEWCAPLMTPDGRIVALKGESVDDEVRDARSILRRRGLVVTVRNVVPYEGAEATRVVVVRS